MPLAFLDALGTRDAAGNLVTVHATIDAILQATLELDGSIRAGRSRGLRFQAFSDSFFVTATAVRNGSDPLLVVLTACAQIMSAFALHGRFLRGGLSFSTVHADDNVLWGPGLVEAYNTETNEAVYPCLRLSDSAATVVSGLTRAETKPLRTLMFRHDGAVFVDYLRALTGIGRIDTLRAHVVEWMTATAVDPNADAATQTRQHRRHAKAAYMAEYFNWRYRGTDHRIALNGPPAFGFDVAEEGPNP